MSETIRFDMYVGPPVDFSNLPPMVTIKGHPARDGETSREYSKRVEREVMADAFSKSKSPIESAFASFLRFLGA